MRTALSVSPSTDHPLAQMQGRSGGRLLGAHTQLSSASFRKTEKRYQENRLSKHLYLLSSRGSAPTPYLAHPCARFRRSPGFFEVKYLQSISNRVYPSNKRTGSIRLQGLGWKQISKKYFLSDHRQWRQAFAKASRSLSKQGCSRHRRCFQ